MGSLGGGWLEEAIKLLPGFCTQLNGASVVVLQLTRRGRRMWEGGAGGNGEGVRVVPRRSSFFLGLVFFCHRTRAHLDRAHGVLHLVWKGVGVGGDGCVVLHLVWVGNGRGEGVRERA